MQQTPTKAPRSINRAATNAPKVRRPLSEAQKKVLPLSPIFAACKARGLKITPENKIARLYEVNKYLCNFDNEGFEWISDSFKELLPSPAAIIVIADAIEREAISWS